VRTLINQSINQAFIAGSMAHKNTHKKTTVSQQNVMVQFLAIILISSLFNWLWQHSFSFFVGKQCKFLAK